MGTRRQGGKTPGPLQGRLIDFPCRYGIISHAKKGKSPKAAAEAKGRDSRRAWRAAEEGKHTGKVAEPLQTPAGIAKSSGIAAGGPGEGCERGDSHDGHSHG